ncbi:transposon protein, putative, CACTA, En/Spm sub-class [Cucumis melo var. makuwa]|uniref:Transposon protein, putative, CACTA, En/Spm sub-class n=1 Tax=Cucumis melo var. makuwa TaxID=1194695 RepID=A0A5D3C6K5_CUCMM|nr:transposon protein, putative, CACTA, En/Spm sub-class [Cucumis melo var. makuwa]
MNNNEGGNDYWKRRSDFFELPYWKNLHVRHCLDVMNIEKNVCMNIVGTLLDIPGKSKDGMNSRLDLVEMNIRPELASMVTVHLVVHLVREVKLCGPVYLRWMYPFERYMKVLKSFVRNRNRPEGCIAEAQQSSAKDKNLVIGDMSFYEIIEDIWEVSYNTFNTVLFKCKWVENKTGVRTDNLHFILVDLSRIGHSSDSFIATHGKQVFYVSDPVDSRWSVVVMQPHKDFPYKCANYDLGDMLSHDPPVSKWNSTSDIDENEDTYTRVDCEGTWVTT